MENRFGLKDLFVILLLLAILAVIVLKIVQDDRQWERLAGIEKQVAQQTRDVAALNRTMWQRLSKIEEQVNQQTEGMAALNQTMRDGIKVIGTVTTTDEHTENLTPDEPVESSVTNRNPYDGTIFRRKWLATQKPDYAEGGTIIQSFGSAPPKLNYLTSHSVYGRVIYTKILEGLAEWDIETLEMVPHLAESWQWSDDLLSLDVKLRTNVVFSDGEPMTADDVVYTWQLKKDPEVTDGHVRAHYAPIKSVEKTGTHSIRFHFEKIHYENFMRAMEVPVLPKHFLSQFTRREIRESPAMVMGTGPYRLPDPTKYTPGEPIELVRNDRYWAIPGSYDRILYRVIENETAELVAFGNGEIDIFSPTPEQHLDMLKNKELRARTQHYVFESLHSGYFYMDWNQYRGDVPTVFKDKRVRRAMTMLIDRQRMCDEIFLGFARVSDGPFNPIGPQHHPDIEPWPYDLDAAIKLLTEAGFTRDGDGRMLTPEGEPFEIKLSYGSGSDLIQKVALFLQDNFARAGIKLNLDPQKWAVLLQNMRQKNYESTLSGWGSGSIESDIEQMFHSRNIAEGDNRNGYRNDELDALIDKAHITLDYEERLKIWHRCHEILHEDQPYTFMNVSKARLWMDQRIRNVQPNPTFGLNSVGTWAVPGEWYIPKTLQRTDR